MPNILSLNGAQATKPTHRAPIYTGRWSSGLWTNRSPLRDANTTRLTEKFYGPAGDALIAGSNAEITNRLTLARRPGNSVYDSNSYSAVNGFHDFRLFSATDEQLKVMVDQATALYSLYSGTKSLVWTKSAGAGQSFMQSVGNSLYFGNGTDNKKWLQTLQTWSAGAAWNTASTPFLSTFLIDPHGNIQQLTGTNIPVTNVAVSGNVLTVTSSEALAGVLSAGMDVQFPGLMEATFLEYEVVTITGVSGNTFTASFITTDYSGTETISITEVYGGVNPTSGATQPTWSTVVPSASNNFQGGITQDGMVRWTNRGNPVQNWGIAAPSTTASPIVGTSHIAWQGNTYYSLPGVVIDSNGNLQQVVGVGKSSGTQPTWSTALHGTTTDGTVTWMMIQTAASLVWQPHTAYTAASSFTLTSVAASSGGVAVYTGAIPNGSPNTFAGQVFLVSSFDKTENNGVYLCTASTNTTLTLANASGVAESKQAKAVSNPSYVVGNAYGTDCLYAPGAYTQPTLTGGVSAYLYAGNTSGAVGCFTLTNPTNLGTALASTTTGNSLEFTGSPLQWAQVNGAGETVSIDIPFPSYPTDYQLIILATLSVPVAGQYTFTIPHHDGMMWGIGNGATLVTGTSDNPIGQTATAAEGYPVFGGTNRGLEGGGLWTDTFTVNFPTAGQYPVEIDYAYWYHSGQTLNVKCNGFALANGTPESGTNPPVWPSWTQTYAPSYPTVTETNGAITWYNLGPVSDLVWYSNTYYTLPGSTIIDSNSNVEAPYRTGVTGTIAPAFGTGVNQLTTDNPNLVWINKGSAATVPNGTVSTFNGGWRYCLALVNTLDNTVSNATPLSASTGNFVGADGVAFAPGNGLDPNSIDPQADYVAIFRSTDGESTPFLIPGTFTRYTLPLSQYLTEGYVDRTPDTGLNNLIEAPLGGQNTPPAAGAQNLTYHLNRIFYSIGNVVYWTAGPDTPCGNGVNGVPPLNYDTLPSRVTRIVPTTSGAIAFTVSGLYLIQGAGTASSPIQNAIPLMQGVGLLSYNALDVNGSIIGFFTTDRQFVILDPSSGVSFAGFPIGDQFRKNNGQPGTAWNPANVYVSWHVSGEDQGWYVSDGQYGWYRLMPTPAPETGYTWSPFATIIGGCKAVQSVEVTPGDHRLLLGPVSNGPLLNRDLTAWTDNGAAYPVYAVMGSAVLAQPGQVATVSFITLDSVNVGTPPVLGLLVDEALPYYTGPFEMLTTWVNDPPGLTPSSSLLGQRFYLSDMDNEAVCRHMQIMVQWPTEDVQNELLSMTIFGGFQQES